MGEEKKNQYVTRETLIAAGIGLLIGVIAMLLIALALGFFAKSAGIARLKHGEETLATVDGKSVTTQTLYDELKKTYGMGAVLNEIDEIIFNDKYDLTEKEKEDAKKQAQSYLDYYLSAGYTADEFYQAYGFSNFDEFLANVELSTKSNKYLYDYLEKRLKIAIVNDSEIITDFSKLPNSAARVSYKYGEDAVKYYYDKYKDDIETYDSEHILVQITDEVPDEQALALANEIIEKLNGGESFDEVVKEYGDRIIHENLGYQGKDASLEQSYIDELVALEDGAYSKTPIQTSYGYHIVHRLSTSTYDELRGTIIEKLSADMLEEDTNLRYKAFIELRKEYNLAIFDEEIKKQYDEYCEKIYSETDISI